MSVSCKVKFSLCSSQHSFLMRSPLSSRPHPFPCVLSHLFSVLLSRTRRLPFGAQRSRSANLCSRIHHHLPVLPPRCAPPVRHPNSRVARRTERVGRRGQRHCFPRSRRHGTSSTTHGSPAVYRGSANLSIPRRKTEAMIVSIVLRPSRFCLSESNVVSNCTCNCLQVA